MTFDLSNSTPSSTSVFIKRNFLQYQHSLDRLDRIIMIPNSLNVMVNDESWMYTSLIIEKEGKNVTIQSQSDTFYFKRSLHFCGLRPELWQGNFWLAHHDVFICTFFSFVSQIGWVSFGLAITKLLAFFVVQHCWWEFVTTHKSYFNSWIGTQLVKLGNRRSTSKESRTKKMYFHSFWIDLVYILYLTCLFGRLNHVKTKRSLGTKVGITKIINK